MSKKRDDLSSGKQNKSTSLPLRTGERRKKGNLDCFPAQLLFYVNPLLQVHRTNIRHHIFSYFKEGMVDKEEVDAIGELVKDEIWLSSKHWLTETKAAELGICRHQYHARVSELRKELRKVDVSYYILSVPNPFKDEVIHFMVPDFCPQKSSESVQGV